jgi:hypothetical protein
MPSFIGRGAAVASTTFGIVVLVSVVAILLIAAPRSSRPANAAATSDAPIANGSVSVAATGSDALGPPTSGAFASASGATAAVLSDDTPLPSPIEAILDDPILHLDLGSIPPDAPPPKITSAEAASILLPMISLPGPALYVAHGVAYINERTPAVTAWLIIARVPPMAAIPVGPMCEGGQQCNWAVNDYAGGFVDDQGGDVLRTFVTSHPVPGPSAEP